MHYLFKFLFLIFVSMAFAMPAFAIRIGLIDGVKETRIAVTNAGGIFDASTGKEILKLQPMTSYTLKNGRRYIQVKINRKYYSLQSKNIFIKTYDAKGFTMAKNRWYRQNLVVMKTSSGLTVINDIDLELYLLGVVPSEMPSSWNIEAHKAQAIAARSYAIANRGKRSSRGYDLKDTPEDQAYGGASSEAPRTTQAVASTRGQVLVNNNKVISAYYHASAGGKTNNSGKIWCKNLPYLHSVKSFDENVPRNGHGVGMSQHGANNMANMGYNAYQILGYFYTNVKLADFSKF